jgi:hypothetical protein
VPLLIRYLPSALSSFLYFTFSFNMVLLVLESFHAADDEEPGDSDLDSVVRSRNANCKELKTPLHTILDMYELLMCDCHQKVQQKDCLFCVSFIRVHHHLLLVLLTSSVLLSLAFQTIRLWSAKSLWCTEEYRVHGEKTPIIDVDFDENKVRKSCCTKISIWWHPLWLLLSIREFLLLFVTYGFFQSLLLEVLWRTLFDKSIFFLRCWIIICWWKQIMAAARAEVWLLSRTDKGRVIRRMGGYGQRLYCMRWHVSSLKLRTWDNILYCIRISNLLCCNGCSISVSYGWFLESMDLEKIVLMPNCLWECLQQVCRSRASSGLCRWKHACVWLVQWSLLPPLQVTQFSSLTWPAACDIHRNNLSITMSDMTWQPLPHQM